MVYELLTGKLPFTGVSTADLLNKHLKSAPPSIQAHNRNLTDEVANLVKRMMAKTPDARPKDVDAFIQEFHRIELYREPPGGVRK
jgi:serine/threonine protein kinase